MKWTFSLLASAAMVALCAGSSRAQAPVDAATAVHPSLPESATNPFVGNEDAALRGLGLYRARCADCHGMDGRGVRGPDLTQVWTSGRTDRGLHQTIRRGIPGTQMPAVNPRTTNDDIWRILAYLRTLSNPVPEPAHGNAENGARIFRAACASCHRVNSQGGRLGPDLTRIGVSRTRASMTRQIRGATEDFINGYEPVTLTMGNGQTIKGVKKNEDLFSVQIMDTRERIQGYLKGDLRAFQNDTRSAMPVFGPERLSQSDLDDLLQYLSTLRGSPPAAP